MHTKILSLMLALLVIFAFGAQTNARAESLNSQEQLLYSLMNQDRARYGLSALELDAQLCAVAREKARDMLANNYCGHTSPTYGNIRQMLTSFGVSYRGASENVARSRSVYHSEAAFLSSGEGHRQTLMSKAWTRVGVGVATTPAGFVYVCQVFAR